jgi:hypothetical protein
VLLVCLAVETGLNLATNIYQKQNGAGNYTPNEGEWPQNENVWYMNHFLMYSFSNMIFCLFCEGLLMVCDKLSNPCSEEDSSFSERCFDSFIYNNVMSMRASYALRRHVLQRGRLEVAGGRHEGRHQ